ncbi:MAG: hypothetical protein ACJ739_17180 [Acidimicrobiales bacterium]
MPFMVIYSTSDGASCHEQADAIDEAALVVERLRNQDGIEEIHIFRMEEISFAFRPYYKVELGMPELVVSSAPPAEVFVAPRSPSPDAGDAGEQPAAAVSPIGAGVAAAGAMVDAATSGPVDESDPSGANGRRGLFGR